MQPSRDKERTYVFDSENAAELARNMSQDRQVTRSMGGALPELPAMDGIRRVLDIAWGMGHRSGLRSPGTGGGGL